MVRLRRTRNFALTCDVVVASDNARFSEIFSKRGLSVDFGGSWLLPRLVGLHRAKELVFLADIIDATEAERIGLVNRVIAHDRFAEVVEEYAQRLAALPPIQVANSKRMLNQSFSVSMPEALDAEALSQAAKLKLEGGLAPDARALSERALSLEPGHEGAQVTLRKALNAMGSKVELAERCERWAGAADPTRAAELLVEAGTVLEADQPARGQGGG